MEEIEHLFHTSELATHPWSHFANIFGARIVFASSWHVVLTNWLHQFNGSSQLHQLALLTPALIAWELWLARNEARYNGGLVNGYKICFKVKHWLVELSPLLRPSRATPSLFHAALYCLGMVPTPLTTKASLLVRWYSPPCDILKLNIEGASCGNPGRAKCDGLLRDWKGKFVFAFSQSFGVITNSMAKAMALKFGLYYCYILGVSKVWVEIDSQVVCHWFNGMGIIPWSLQQVWDDIVDMADFIDLKVTHIFLEANSIADSLAKMGTTGHSQFSTYISAFSKTTIGCFILDSSGCPSFRIR